MFHPTTAGATALDPVENISVKVGDGRYRRQFEQASTSGAWGYEWSACGNRTLSRVADGYVQIAPVLCDTWACPMCGPRRVAWLKREIGLAVPRHNLRWFWTLTIWTETCTAPESFGLATKAWNIVNRNLKRDRGPFSYLWTIEATKRGYAHLHLLTSLHIERPDLSHRWQNATDGSFIVDVQGIASTKAANYLAKYCVQQATMRREPEWATLRGKRLFSKSRDVAFQPFRGHGDGSWGMVPLPYWSMARLLRQAAPVASERVAGVPSLSVHATAAAASLVPRLVPHLEILNGSETIHAV